MDIVQIPIGDLKPATYNPRRLTDKQYNDLKNSMQEFGIVDPIIANKHPDRENIVIGGHQRLRVAMDLKYEKVPVVYLDLSEEKERELNLRLNRNTGEFDWDILANNFEIEELLRVGFDEADLDIVKESGGKEEKVPPVPTKPRSKLGEIYLLDKHRIMCGSSTSEENIKDLVNGQDLKLIFTSPPYNMGAEMYQNYEDDMKSEEYIKFNLDVVKKYRPYLKGFLFWNISYNKNSRWEFIEIMHRIIKETNLTFLELVVWNKKHAMPITSPDMMTRQYEDILAAGDPDTIREDLEMFVCGRSDIKAVFNKKTQRALTNYWEIGTGNTQIETHKAMFPVDLPTKGIMVMTKIGDVVCDPFLGAGSTLIAAERANRTCYGMELDPGYLDVCLDRWSEYTGKDPVRASDGKKWSEIKAESVQLPA